MIRGVATTGRTGRVGAPLVGRQGGRWVSGGSIPRFLGAAARSHDAPPPADTGAAVPAPEDRGRRGLLTEAESKRLRMTTSR